MPVRALASGLLTIAFLLSGCDASQEPVQPAVNLGVGVGSGGVNTYGGVGFFQGPLSVYLGF